MEQYEEPSGVDVKFRARVILLAYFVVVAILVWVSV